MSRSAANRISDSTIGDSRANDDVFVNDLATRIAAICNGSPAATSAATSRAIPLPGQPEAWRSEPHDRGENIAEPIVAPNSNASAVALYTEDGHLRPLDDIEADILRLAVTHYRGRITEVARRLNLGRSTVYRKLNDLGYDYR